MSGYIALIAADMIAWYGSSVRNCSHSKVHGANMGPTWGRQDPGGPHVGHVNRAALVVALIRDKQRSFVEEVRILKSWCAVEIYFVSQSNQKDKTTSFKLYMGKMKFELATGS